MVCPIHGAQLNKFQENFQINSHGNKKILHDFWNELNDTLEELLYAMVRIPTSCYNQWNICKQFRNLKEFCKINMKIISMEILKEVQWALKEFLKNCWKSKFKYFRKQKITHFKPKRQPVSHCKHWTFSNIQPFNSEFSK